MELKLVMTAQMMESGALQAAWESIPFIPVLQDQQLRLLFVIRNVGTGSSSTQLQGRAILVMTATQQTLETVRMIVLDLYLAIHVQEQILPSVLSFAGMGFKLFQSNVMLAQLLSKVAMLAN